MLEPSGRVDSNSWNRNPTRRSVYTLRLRQRYLWSMIWKSETLGRVILVELWQINSRTMSMRTMNMRTMGMRTMGMRTMGMRTMGMRTMGMRTMGMRTMGMRTMGMRTMGMRTMGMRRIRGLASYQQLHGLLKILPLPPLKCAHHHRTILWQRHHNPKKRRCEGSLVVVTVVIEPRLPNVGEGLTVKGRSATPVDCVRSLTHDYAEVD